MGPSQQCEVSNPMCVVHVFVQIEQVSQLSSLVESQLQYHRQAVQVLEELFDKLRDRYVYAEKQTWC